LTWSLGYRHVDYTELRSFTGLTGALPFNFATQKDFDGDGLTAGLEARRLVGCCWGLFGNVRSSVVFGDERTTLLVLIDGINQSFIANQNNVVHSIFETQLGAEFVRPTSRGATLFARGGVEAQYWDGFGVGDTLTLDESVGFFGFFGTVGVSR
jgi:hypothetical protein